MEKRVIKIAITGPESTGKTTLAEQLSLFFKVDGVPEYARKFLLERGGAYTRSDLITIAEGQRNAIQNTIASSVRLVIVDTEMTVMKVWSEFKFGTLDEKIKSYWEEEKWDLVLLTGTDIPWEYDELREHPEQREVLYDLYKKALQLRGDRYIELWGSEKERFEKAKSQIEKLLADSTL